MEGEEKNKRTGLIISILFHGLLILVFAFFGLTYLDPPPEDEGITINFGTSDQGMMNNPNNTINQEVENTPSETVVSEPVPAEAVDEEVLTQNSEEAPSIDKKKEKKEEVIEPVKKEEPKPDKNLSDAINKWKNKSPAGGGGDGNTGTPGDQGDINGDPNSSNYTGGGSGDGISFNLSGRTMVKKPTIKDNSQEEGKVVVDIFVDKYGKVIRANAGARGSTTSNSTLYKKAKEAALATKFNANPNALEEQKGQMTFIFILN